MSGPVHVWGSEADLCEAAAAALRPQGWDVWPEVGGWDLVLVRREDAPRPAPCQETDWLRAGMQVGVEAKLRAGVGVLAQVVGRIEYYGRGHCPDACAILVPSAGPDFQRVCQALGVGVMRADAPWNALNPWRPPPSRWPPPRLSLSEIPLQGPGGRASPRVMSRWRVAALRLCLLMEAEGRLLSADFKAAGINPSRWIDAAWLRRDGMAGRDHVYVRSHQWERGPLLGYEAEAAALREAGR